MKIDQKTSWTYEYNPYRTQDGRETPCFEIVDSEGRRVAMTEEGTPRELQEANARLIAAAGGLLDALEYAIQALNTAPCFGVPHLDTNSYAIASICDRAIARAKGGAS